MKECNLCGEIILIFVFGSGKKVPELAVIEISPQIFLTQGLVNELGKLGGMRIY